MPRHIGNASIGDRCMQFWLYFFFFVLYVVQAWFLQTNHLWSYMFMAQILVALIVLASYRKRPWNHGHYGMPAGLLFIIIILDFSCYVLVWFGMVQRIQEISPKLHHNERDTITMLGVMMVAGSIASRIFILSKYIYLRNFHQHNQPEAAAGQDVLHTCFEVDGGGSSLSGCKVEKKKRKQPPSPPPGYEAPPEYDLAINMGENAGDVKMASNLNRRQDCISPKV